MRGRAAGYSAVELMMAVGIASVLSSMALLQIGAARPSLKGDGAMRVVLGQVKPPASWPSPSAAITA